jgi:hypothetical protein
VLAEGKLQAATVALIALTSAAGCGGTTTKTVTVRVPARTVTAPVASQQTHTQPLPQVVRFAPQTGLPHLAALVPEDAQVLNAQTLAAAGGVPEQVVVTWRRQTHPDDYAEHALVIWQRSRNARDGTFWRRIYQLDRYRYAHKIHVENITAHVADITGDGHLDVLAYQDTGGTGLCGEYDLLATADGAVHNVFHASECLDDTVLALRPDALVIDRGLAYAPGGHHIHPVFKTFRRTLKRWNGQRLVTARRFIIKPSQMLNGPYGPPLTSCRAPRHVAHKQC